jgi:hypothetical protein
MSLRDYLHLLEAGGGTMLRTDLAKRLGADVHDLLTEARLLAPGPPSPSWTCARTREGEMTRCPGEAEAPAVRSKKSDVAPYARSEDRCEVAPIEHADLARETMDLLAFARFLRRLLRLEDGQAAAVTWNLDLGRPLLLGTEREADDAPTDVFLVPHPRREWLGDFLVARELATRSTRVLVPTARNVLPEVSTRHGAGARVQLEVLEDTLFARDGAIVRAARLHLVRRAEGPTSEPVKRPRPRAAKDVAIAAAVGATTWEQLKITSIDGHVVRIQCGDKIIRRSFIDLGFGGGRREPIDKWKYVLALCAGRGQFRWKRFGRFAVVKNGMSVVRKLLRGSFGIAEDPFHRFRAVDGWRARFQAGSEFDDPTST